MKLSFCIVEQDIEDRTIGARYERLRPAKIEFCLNQPPLPDQELRPGQISLAQIGRSFQLLLQADGLAKVIFGLFRLAHQAKDDAQIQPGLGDARSGIKPLKDLQGLAKKRDGSG